MRKRLILWIALAIFAILPFSLALAATSPDIPGSAVKFNGHSYYLYKKGLSWPNAKKACEKVGGHLVTISSAAENDVVSKLVAKLPENGQDAWIGFYKSAVYGTWQTVTGEAVTYTNWRPLYFDPATADGYAYLSNYPNDYDFSPEYSGTWSAEPGEDLMFYYVCEWDTVPVTVSAPQAVKADQPAANTVRLVWSPGANARKYVIWRKTGSSPEYKKIGETKKLTFSYKDKTAKNGGTYLYKIQAVNGDQSAYSSVVKAYPMDKVKSLQAKHKKDGKITLTWKKVSGAAKYLVYQKGPGEDAFKKVKTVRLSTKTTVSVYPGYGKYQFYVVPVRGSFEGMKSKKVSVDVPIR